jgi:signal transduction histidine kinase
MTPRLAERVQIQQMRSFVIGFVILSIPHFVRLALGKVNLRHVVYSSLWLVFGLGLSLVLISIFYRFAMDRGVTLQRACAQALLASVPAMMVASLVDLYLTTRDPSLSPYAAERASVRDALALSLADGIAMSSFMAAIVFLPLFATAHEQRSHEIEDLAREAELLRYRAHLEPHFVLNSLNAVAGLVEDDPPQARELLAALGDLFRDAVSFHGTHQVRDELAWLERYVTIYQLRYPDRLTAEWDAAPETKGLSMPALLLQPLIENAIKHGALRGQGRLAVRSCLVDGQLELTVQDDGPALGTPRAGGRGLSIVRRRLELEGNPDQGAFELTREGDRTVARVRLPARSGVKHD